MADRKYSLNDFKGLLAAELRKGLREWEDVLVDLRKRELAKDDSGTHYEPGNHETPGTGAAPHMEPGTHESHSMGPGGLAVEPAQDPVGSDSGVPMNGQPPDSTPGGMTCPMCNQPDLPGKCQCLGQPVSTPGGANVDGFDSYDPDLGADADLGGGDLRMSEKPLNKAQKRKLTPHQVKAMATKKDELDDVVDSVGGVYNSVKRAALAHESASKKKPAAQKNEEMGYGGDGSLGANAVAGNDLEQSEPLDKDLASATAELRTQNKLLNAANQIRAPKYGLGDQKPMGKKFTKEEWIDIANEGDHAKRLKNVPDNVNETAVPASAGNKGAEKRGQGVEPKTVAGATSEKYPVTKGVKKGEVPMAKPPSGQNMGTAVPKAKVAAPKLPGAGAGPGALAAPAAPKLPKPPGMGKAELEKGLGTKLLGGALLAGSLATGAAVKPAINHAKAKVTQSVKAPVQAKPTTQKAEMPAGKQMAMQANSAAHKAHLGGGAAAAPAVKLPGAHEDAQRAQMYADFMPKPTAKPAVPGLKAPPKLPGMGLKPTPKPMFGKGEMEDLKCSMCKAAEHPGECK